MSAAAALALELRHKQYVSAMALWELCLIRLACRTLSRGWGRNGRHGELTEVHRCVCFPLYTLIYFTLALFSRMRRTTASLMVSVGQPQCLPARSSWRLDRVQNLCPRDSRKQRTSRDGTRQDKPTLQTREDKTHQTKTTCLSCPWNHNPTVARYVSLGGREVTQSRQVPGIGNPRGVWTKGVACSRKHINYESEIVAARKNHRTIGRWSRFIS